VAAAKDKSKAPVAGGHGASLDALAEAVETGAGLPEVARVASRLLNGPVALIDRSSAVLAVAGASADQEQRLLSGGKGVVSVDLRVAAAAVGELRYRSSSDPDPIVARMVPTLLALELERSRAPEWATEEAAAGFVHAVLTRDVTDRKDLLARAGELGAELAGGGGVVIARAAPRTAQEGDWRARVLTLAVRALRSASQGSLASLEESEWADVAAIVPAADDEALERAAGRLEQELAESLPKFSVAIGRSRRADDPVDLYRAGKEARLAVNVGEAEGAPMTAFEDTGAYRLLLPAMSEDPGELERFYSETIEPLAAYDEQYETDLVATVETYLENDGSVASTAQRLFTHRHTVRYRLERVKELCGHDVTSTEGREKLGLGLKSMRVLGIPPPRGPANEPGAEAGKVRRGGEE
jgi:sugar diacid utilization regulator